MLTINYPGFGRIVSGKDCLKNYSGLCSFGSRAFIVCGKNSARISGALRDMESVLEKENISYVLFDSVGANPLLEMCFQAGKKARDEKCDFVIGIGGGSALDAAKAIAVFAANPELDPMDVYETGLIKEVLPVIAVGITAGTGSEVTPVSVLTVPEMATKKSFRHDGMIPKIAFLDPTYTSTLSPLQTWATATDALCHAIEGYFMKKATPITDAIAETCVPMIAEGMKRIRQGDNGFETREKLLYGSTLAGLVIAGTGTGFVHSSGYPITIRHGYCHGWANAFTIADFLGFMAKNDSQRGQKMFSALGMSSADDFFEFIASEPDMPMNGFLDEATATEYAESVSKVKNITAAMYAIGYDELREIFIRRWVK